MKTPKQVNSMELVTSCVGINISQWDQYMEGTTKANVDLLPRINPWDSTVKHSLPPQGWSDDC